MAGGVSFPCDKSGDQLLTSDIAITAAANTIGGNLRGRYIAIYPSPLSPSTYGSDASSGRK